MTGFALGPFLLNLLYAAITVIVVLGFTFLVGVRLRLHTVIDVAWGLGFAAVALVSYVASAGDGEPARRQLVALLTVIWGVRLAAHIVWRGRGKGEDPRYESLLKRAPEGKRNLYALRLVYLSQGAVMWLVSLPVQAAMYEAGGLNSLAYLGIFLWLVGISFESIADAQLASFKADPDNKGKVLDTGLWRYSRHPNYFGDALVWWGLFLLACGRWPGVLTIISPLVMTYLLAKGTGKPLLEKRLKNTRAGYAEYIARTSGFVPLPPKKAPRHQRS